MANDGRQEIVTEEERNGEGMGEGTWIIQVGIQVTKGENIHVKGGI